MSLVGITSSSFFSSLEPPLFPPAAIAIMIIIRTTINNIPAPKRISSFLFLRISLNTEPLPTPNPYDNSSSPKGFLLPLNVFNLSIIENYF